MSLTLKNILTATDAAVGDAFGYSVSIAANGNVLAVGALLWEGASTNQGCVYIYDRNGSSWIQRGSVLTAADAAASDFFGTSVSLSADGNILAVGVINWEGSVTNQGGVYIYDRNGSSWTQRGAVLTAADAAIGDGFGYSVSLSTDGNILAVGAINWEGSVTDQGGVYIYDRNGSSWTQRGAVLTAADAAASDNFGYGVSLSANGDVLVVVALYWEGSVTDQGGVYIYDRNGSSWTQRGAVLTAADAASGKAFGISVALSSNGDVLAVGAYLWDATATDQGGVYIYDRNGSGWMQRSAVLTATDAAVSDGFGIGVSFSGDGKTLIVGALYWEGAATDQGAVYEYVSYTLSGVIVESLAANTFIARAYDVVSGALVGVAKITDTSSFTINGVAKIPCYVTVSADYKAWQAETIYALDDKVFPSDPTATPYYYKRTVSGVSGTTEPTWPTTPAGQCNDGASVNAWERVERLIQPITHGPRIPS